MFLKVWELKIFKKQTHVDPHSADLADTAVRHCCHKWRRCTKEQSGNNCSSWESRPGRWGGRFLTLFRKMVSWMESAAPLPCEGKGTISFFFFCTFKPQMEEQSNSVWGTNIEKRKATRWKFYEHGSSLVPIGEQINWGNLIKGRQHQACIMCGPFGPLRNCTVRTNSWARSSLSLGSLFIILMNFSKQILLREKSDET